MEDLNFAERIDKEDDDSRLYYRGSFVTDLIKIRLRKEKAEEVLSNYGKREDSKWKRYLKKEIEVVDPLLIVALGSRTYRTLIRKRIVNRPVEKTYHYGSLRFPNNEKELRDQLGRVNRVYEFLKGER
ncbi:hypothetical protein AKJ49_00885 [candidate division MSBL1 archaeon SCGC-AAA382A03]|uniref:Uracil-DNA glycosylase-like domain-containing protein n=1 Tax=candidate division MSBL1 archaeon SCGC-AAA382A03 TaxID=1698278 RepID=A0A133VG29_9EURY|nr:hypothetical protein AKJ49_00885 [candidate division MSBL1 archaeon SCGC-AAA382A03]